MRRNLTTLRAKQGHSQNGAPRALIDLAMYREFQQQLSAFDDNAPFDTEYSGFSNANRPKDQSISVRSVVLAPR